MPHMNVDSVVNLPENVAKTTAGFDAGKRQICLPFFGYFDENSFLPFSAAAIWENLWNNAKFYL